MIEVLVTLPALNHFGMEVIDSMVVSKARTQKSILAVVGSSSPLHDFSIRPVCLHRVKSEAIDERDTINRFLYKVIDEHGVDTKAGKDIISKM
jgi:hypothetical protein